MPASRRSSLSLLLALIVAPVIAVAWTAPAAAGPFVRGDVNGDGSFDIADAVTGLSHLFGGGALSCEDALDSNDDGLKDIADAVHILAALFSGGALPAPPHPGCGEDPTADPLDCDIYIHCACAPDLYEPNDTAGTCESLGSISDGSSFPAGVLSIGLADGTDEDWFCYHIVDGPLSSLEPRVVVSGIAPDIQLLLEIQWTCDTGGFAFAQAQNPLGSGSIDLSLPDADQTCTAGSNDSMEIRIRLLQIAGPTSCAPLQVAWGDD